MRAFRFEEGRNCWRIAPARRIAVLVDGEAYFAAVRSALLAAERRVVILAWDIHSRVTLVREDPGDGLPTELGDLILALLERNPRLHVHILLWSWAPIYALEREPLFFGDSPWHKHPRLHFATDDDHPVAGSQHQKLVAVDGQIAFCGGFDLSKWRWDTTEHRAADARRVDARGRPYPPFHDVQMLVDGEAAAALERLAALRWRRATGTGLDRGASPASDPWPPDLVPLLQRHRVAIARTLPAHEGRREVREVECLYLETIAKAEDFLYVENQYLTSAAVRDGLIRRLRRRHGPEIILVLPRHTGDWLEQHTMDVLRARLLRPLREADRHGRLRVYYPAVPGLEEGCLMVHAKLLIADDCLLRVGSSNLSNRSMGLDSECDLCLFADDAGERAAIAGLRRRLLGMLLGVDPEAVAAAEAREGGLIAAVESLRSDGRTLAPLSGEVDPEWERQLPDGRLIDPDRPLEAADVGDAMLGQRHLAPARRRFLLGAVLVALLLALAAAWRWTDIGEWLEPAALAEALTSVLHGPWGPLALAAGYVLGSLAAIPVTLLILVTALVYGPALGAAYALGGSLLAAAVTFALGAWLGRSTVERLSGGSVQRLSKSLGRRGILTIVTVRIIPVAPFTVINLFAGASHIRFRDYLVGTFVGMLPGVAAMAVFAEGILALVRGADLGHFVVAALALIFIVAVMVITRRLLARAGGLRNASQRED